MFLLNKVELVVVTFVIGAATVAAIDMGGAWNQVISPIAKVFGG